VGFKPQTHLTVTKSATFERNNQKVIDIVESIPSGRCTTYGAIGEAIGIVPRYVALIMATGNDIHAAPWHRVVGSDSRVKPGPQKTEQIRRLKAEGFQLLEDRIIDFHDRFVQP
jgi:alkylated DNA nucleotide flippase Atl1